MLDDLQSGRDPVSGQTRVQIEFAVQPLDQEIRLSVCRHCVRIWHTAAAMRL